jgi:hypothetical protein
MELGKDASDPRKALRSLTLGFRPEASEIPTTQRCTASQFSPANIARIKKALVKWSIAFRVG